MKDIRSVKLKIPENLESDKKHQLNLMMDQYTESVRHHLELGWNFQNLNPDDVNLKVLSKPQMRFPKKEILSVPDMKSSIISGRLESFARDHTQAIINSRRKTMLRDFHIAGWCHKNGHESAARTSQRRISKNLRSFKRPEIQNLNMELSSKIVTIKERKTFNDNFEFIFQSMWSQRAKENINKSNKFDISIPSNTRTVHWEKNGYKLMSGVLVGNGWIEVRFSKEVEPIKDGDITLAIDQGIRNLITAALSTGEKYSSGPNKDGKDLKIIMDQIMKKKAGSRNRKQAIREMVSYVRYSVNLMFKHFNLKDGRVKMIILEDVRQMKGKNKYTSMVPFGILREALESKCKQYGIQFKFQGNAYRSQRCSHCGYVHKGNRKGKIFLCRKCTYVADADENAVDNHFADIPTISYDKNKGKLDNRKNGFYWFKGGLITDVEKFPEIILYKS